LGCAADRHDRPAPHRSRRQGPENSEATWPFGPESRASARRTAGTGAVVLWLGPLPEFGRVGGAGRRFPGSLPSRARRWLVSRCTRAGVRVPRGSAGPAGPASRCAPGSPEGRNRSIRPNRCPGLRPGPPRRGAGAAASSGQPPRCPMPPAGQHQVSAAARTRLRITSLVTSRAAAALASRGPRRGAPAPRACSPGAVFAGRPGRLVAGCIPRWRGLRPAGCCRRSFFRRGRRRSWRGRRNGAMVSGVTPHRGRARRSSSDSSFRGCPRRLAAPPRRSGSPGRRQHGQPAIRGGVQCHLPSLVVEDDRGDPGPAGTPRFFERDAQGRTDSQGGDQVRRSGCPRSASTPGPR